MVEKSLELRGEFKKNNLITWISLIEFYPMNINRGSKKIFWLDVSEPTHARARIYLAIILEAKFDSRDHWILIF